MRTLIVRSVLQTAGIAALVVHAFGGLRAISREEFASLQPSARVNESSPAQTPPRNLSLDALRTEAVAQHIEAYRGAGSITDAQMQELQTDIAQLDQAGRKQMMSKLMRALSSGEIKGRL